MTTPGPLNLRGVFPALVTPFSRDGSVVDTKSLGNLIDKQLAAGVHGVVACGSTGEAMTLSDSEYIEVVKFVRERTKGKVPCVAGISASATSRAVEMAKVNAELGCDGILVATPPYNKPSQVGIIEHFKAIRQAVKTPLIAYNIPGRSGVAMSSATLGTLSHEGLISGIKESSGSVDALADTMLAVTSQCQVVAGDDSLYLAVLAYGGTGIISVTANALPGQLVAMHDAFCKGDVAEARRIQMSLLPQMRAAFVESNPVPIKAVLALQGTIQHPTVRLPLVPLAAPSLERIRKEFGV